MDYEVAPQVVFRCVDIFRGVTVYAMQDFEQTPVVDFTNNEITSDSNIITYSQYLQETQQAAVQDTNLRNFGKRFVPQQELSAKQAFWFHMSNPSTESSDASPVKVEVPSELPKVSLVNESLKKIKLHLAKFNSVVKIRTTPDALTEGEWGFEHTKTVFINEIIPFLKSLKDIFNVFDKDILNEITKVQIVFNQMEAVVQQCSVDKQCFEIVKKELFLENDRLLQKIMSQDVLLSVMNTISLNGESVNVEMQRSESCDKCFNLDAELSKIQNAYNDLLKKYFKNNDLKAQLQDKDTTICKLKEIIKSMRENNKEEKVNHDRSELETINEELENRLKRSTSDSRSKPTGNKKNDRILPPQNVKHSLLNANSELICATCNQCMFDAIHDMRVLDFVKNVNGRSKSAKKHKKQNIWKPTGHVFTKVGFKWKPTGRTFTLVSNSCPLTRITLTKVVPIKESTSNSVETQKPKLKVYSRRPKHVKNVGSSKKEKILESKNANTRNPIILGDPMLQIFHCLLFLVNDRKDRLCSHCALGKSKGNPQAYSNQMLRTLLLTKEETISSTYGSLWPDACGEH
ncbi:hypothetical protein Tco_0129097 [Tanacetum coccineum]